MPPGQGSTATLWTGVLNKNRGHHRPPSCPAQILVTLLLLLLTSPSHVPACSIPTPGHQYQPLPMPS